MLSSARGISILAFVLLTLAPFAARPARAELPFTEKQDAGGARFVRFVLNPSGQPREYEPCEAIPNSKHYGEVETPRPGDIIWWPQLMAIYHPAAPEGQEVIAAGKRLSLRELEKKFGKPKYFRVRVRCSEG